MSNVSRVNANTYSIADTLALFDIVIDDVDSVNLVNDSRQIKAGDIFCATIGTEQDGRQRDRQPQDQGDRDSSAANMARAHRH